MAKESTITTRDTEEMVRICAELTRQGITFFSYKNDENEWVIELTWGC